ncbi:conserved hypothetical protein [Acinetobacter phage Ac42]|uniref:hypothetical protein n=1 Tax=Acinetobacter phage Ac42 TaxID=762660 RepID=UPI0001EBCCED|nr:hypothetical protein Ac42p083 [Acinetobacter phage Ac42]ADI96321.1 conserved hypothetical protein [Acinetobacter phage Ac42]
MKKVVILGAGLATRLYPITHYIPKVLVNYGQHTILKHLYDLYSQYNPDEIIVVVHSKFKLLTESYCRSQGIKVTIETVDEAYGSAYAISRIPNLNGHNVVFNWCDVIPKFDSFSWDCDHIYTFGDECRFNFDGKTQELKEVGATGGNVVGVYQINDFYIKSFVDKEVANDFYRGIDFISTLVPNTMYEDELIDLVDLGDKVKLEKAHKNLIVPRDFNKVEITENMVYKTAINEKGRELQDLEVNWYMQIDSKSVPKILNYRGHDEGSMISMERIKGKEFYKCFDKHRINDVLEALEFNPDVQHQMHRKTIERDFKYEVIDKVIDRCDSIYPLIVSLAGNVQYVNGVKIGRLKPMLEQAYNHLVNAEENQVYNVIHGDPNFSNIFIDENDNVKIIDPRGYFGQSNIMGPRMYDECKVLYAITGYDNFNSDPLWGGFSKGGLHHVSVTIDPLVNRPYDLPEFNSLHQLWVGVIWVALGGYFKNNPLKAVSAYLYGMYLLTRALKRVGRRLKDGTRVYDIDKPIRAELVTRTPRKWLLTDLETGEKYYPSDKGGCFDWEKL